MDNGPRDIDEPLPEQEAPSDAPDGVIGEIQREEPREPEPAFTEPRHRKPRSRMIGCLLALLGALAGAGLAVWYSRDTAQQPPVNAELAAPAAEGGPSARLLFSPTPERPDETPEIISSETEMIWVFYELPGIPATASLSGIWSHEDHELGELPLDQLEPEPAAQHATGRFVVHPPEGDAASVGFPPGIYRVTLTSPDHPDLAVEASFVALPRAAQILQGGGEPEGPPAIRSLQTATGVSDAGEVVGATSVFAPDAGRILAVFSYEGIVPGSVLEVRWYIEETELTAAASEIAISAPRGRGEAWLETSPDERLPEGSYRVAVHLGDEAEPLATTGFAVSSEAAPSPIP
jgi:hypothetical protein